MTDKEKLAAAKFLHEVADAVKNGNFLNVVSWPWHLNDIAEKLEDETIPF